MGKNEPWDGRYETSREGQQSLEDDILDAGIGKFAYPTSTGGTVKETDHSINVYGPSNSEKGHSHSWYNKDTNKPGHHD